MYEFNQKNFEKYFFYGIDNRDELLEGIIFFTNKDLNTKYLNKNSNFIYIIKIKNACN